VGAGESATETVRALFDADWYCAGGEPFAGDPFEHFVTVGWRAGRSPHALFDVDFYLAQAGSDVAAGSDPLTHFVLAGAGAGLSPHPLFDTAFYERRYGEELDGANPLLHYLTEGAALNLDPHPYFSTAFYREHSPDLRDDVNPLAHYAVYGGHERNRRPHPQFSPVVYAQRKRIPEGMNPLVHVARRIRALKTAAYPVPSSPAVSAIVLNLDKSLLTIECVLELLDAHGASGDVEVVVVDNGSDPLDFDHLAHVLPAAVRVVRLEENRFFGEGSNIGVEASRGRMLLFLNNDAFVDRRTIPVLLQAHAAHPDAGAVGPLLLYPDGRIQEAGAVVMPCGTVVQRAKFLEDLPPWLRRTEPVDYVSAACFMMPRSVFDELGGFDLAWEPAYYEDVDLCLKLEFLGKRTYFCPDAAVTHLENATSGDERLGLHNVVAVNRQKFVARWGEYLAAGRDPARATVALPPPLREPVGKRGKAVIYTPYALSPGGGERFVMAVASQLSEDYDTYVVTPERYSSYRLRGLAAELDLDLSAVRLAPVSALASHGDCDVFVALANEVMPPIAPVGRLKLYVCQFPFPINPHHLARVYGRLEQYDRVLVYSEFVAQHFAARAATISARVPPISVLPPPCPSFAGDEAGRVAGRILHIGRFTEAGHCKRQDALVHAFRRLVDESGRDDLELHLVGVVPPDGSSRAYYEKVRDLARGYPISIHVHAPARVLHEQLRSASYYWHATGYGYDERLYPERQEHFGIVVVEAMSAGVIPLVYATGGPVSVVADGKSGFHWRTEEDLVERQLQLLGSEPGGIASMRRAAERAAHEYDEYAFRLRFREILGGAAVPV
jgi:GT2 family glycosyltransferase/glycosyltransferase involved in cell wall biosynthesis